MDVALYHLELVGPMAKARESLKLCPLHDRRQNYSLEKCIGSFWFSYRWFSRQVFRREASSIKRDKNNSSS